MEGCLCIPHTDHDHLISLSPVSIGWHVITNLASRCPQQDRSCLEPSNPIPPTEHKARESTQPQSARRNFQSALARSDDRSRWCLTWPVQESMMSDCRRQPRGRGHSLRRQRTSRKGFEPGRQAGHLHMLQRQAAHMLQAVQTLRHRPAILHIPTLYSPTPQMLNQKLDHGKACSSVSLQEQQNQPDSHSKMVLP